MKQEEETHNENLKILKEEDEIYAMQSYLYVMGLMMNVPRSRFFSRFVHEDVRIELFQECYELQSELENCDTATANLVSRFGKLKTVVRKCHEVEAWLNERRGQENGSIVVQNIELRGTAEELER
ncbi:hypothetical protein Droror1_Dr00022265 [Drosera rotundifolia]